LSAPDRTTLDAGDDRALLESGRATLNEEAAALTGLADGLDERFAASVRVLHGCQGRVLTTGLGKSGIVARKLAATLTSTGTPSHFIHPVEAAHGDLGVVRGGDVMVAISRSGNNPEVTELVANCRQLGMTAIAMVGNADSGLAAAADHVLPVPVAREACPLGLTPTTSAVAAMAMGDALAVALIRLRGFRREDFAVFHPSGVLGRGLLVTVGDLMHTGDELPVVHRDLTLRESLPEIVDKRLGGVAVVDDDGRLAGLCVDGDVKRILLEREDALDRPISEAMNADPTTVPADMLALTALRRMEQRRRGPVTLLLVTDDARRPVGLLHIHDVLRAGLL
jgi:arabinose-5-phosphate isomerase